MSKQCIAITGASSGIGKAVARVFFEHDYPLLLLSRQTEHLTEFHHDNVLIKNVDITQLDEYKDAIQTAEQKLGQIDCLINNAGILNVDPIAVQKPNDWQEMINVNLMGTINGISLVTNKMIKKQKGTIVNISSIAGKQPYPNLAVYAATKYAIQGLSDSIRKELATSNIRVITIIPGYTETALYDNIQNTGIKQSFDTLKNSLGKVLSPSDVANIIFNSYQLPQHVCIQEITITPTKQT